MFVLNTYHDAAWKLSWCPGQLARRTWENPRAAVFGLQGRMPPAPAGKPSMKSINVSTLEEPGSPGAQGSIFSDYRLLYFTETWLCALKG